MVSRTTGITLVTTVVAWIGLATLLGAWGTQNSDFVLQFSLLSALAIAGGLLAVDRRFASTT